LYDIPNKYRKKGVLHDILLQAISNNWDRCSENYRAVLNYLDSHGIDRDVDIALLRRLRKDVRIDGIEFVESRDGIASRLNSWLVECFPKAF